LGTVRELIGQAKFLLAYAIDSSEAEPIAREGLAAFRLSAQLGRGHGS
jgi:hypothetical protein